MEDINKPNQVSLDFFGLKNDFTREDLENIYKPLIKKWHTDINNQEEALEKSQEINEHYDKLKRYLLNKNQEKQLIEDRKEYDDFKNSFLNDIKNLQEKYTKNKEMALTCKRFLESITVIDNIKTSDFFNKLNELRIKKREFNDKVKEIKLKIEFEDFKNSFFQILKNDKKTSQDDFRNLAIFYQEKLIDIYNIRDLEELKKKYQEDKVILEQKINDNDLLEFKNKKIQDFLKLKEENDHGKINNLVDLYKEKILVAKTYDEIENIQFEFINKLNEIKQEIIKFNKIKEELLVIINKYQEEYPNKKSLEALRNELDQKTTIEELNGIKSTLEFLIKVLPKEEINSQNYTNNLTNLSLKACLSKLEKAIIGVSFERINECLEIFKKILLILENTSYDSVKSISELVTNIEYDDLDLDNSKLNIWILTKSGKFKNQMDIDEYIEKHIKEKSEFKYLKENNLSKEREEIIKIIIEKWYLKAISSDILEIKVLINILENILKNISILTESELYEYFDVIKKIEFNDLDKVKVINEKLSLANRIYINIKTGEIVRIEIDGDNLIVIPIDSLDKGVQIYNKDKSFKNFITIREFFNNAKYVNGRTVYERVNRYITKGVLFSVEDNYLYHNGRLMLIYIEPVFNKFEPYFKFISARSAFGWKTDDDIIVNNQETLKFSDLKKCEEMLLNQIKKQLDLEKVHEETIDF